MHELHWFQTRVTGAIKKLCWQGLHVGEVAYLLECFALRSGLGEPVCVSNSRSTDVLLGLVAPILAFPHVFCLSQCGMRSFRAYLLHEQSLPQ